MEQWSKLKTFDWITDYEVTSGPGLYFKIRSFDKNFHVTTTTYLGEPEKALEDLKWFIIDKSMIDTKQGCRLMGVLNQDPYDRRNKLYEMYVTHREMKWCKELGYDYFKWREACLKKCRSLRRPF